MQRQLPVFCSLQLQLTLRRSAGVGASKAKCTANCLPSMQLSRQQRSSSQHARAPLRSTSMCGSARGMEANRGGSTCGISKRGLCHELRHFRCTSQAQVLMCVKIRKKKPHAPNMELHRGRQNRKHLWLIAGMVSHELEHFRYE